MINPAYDVFVWIACGLFLVLMAARAWTVETGQARLGRTTAKVRLLTGGTAVVLAVLVALLAVQGGTLLVDSILTGTDPAVAYDANQPGADGGAAPAPTTGG